MIRRKRPGWFLEAERGGGSPSPSSGLKCNCFKGHVGFLPGLKRPEFSSLLTSSYSHKTRESRSPGHYTPSFHYCYNQGAWRGVQQTQRKKQGSVTVQQVESTPEPRASPRVPHQVLDALFPLRLPSDVPGQTAKDGPIM